jgi:hypothetical protein
MILFIYAPVNGLPQGGGGGSGLPTGFDILLTFFVNFPNMGRPDEVKLPSLGKEFLKLKEIFNNSQIHKKLY